MEEQEYRNEIQSITLLASLVRPIRVSDVLRAMEHAETIGPILDPTLYIRTAKRAGQQKRLVEATLRFQMEVEKIASER